MGAKTWMVVYSDGDAAAALRARPALDRGASAALAAKLFPREKLAPLEDGSLQWTAPPNRELMIGVFPGATIVAAKEFGGDFPSRLAPRFLAPELGGTALLLAMHSVVDWFAYGLWSSGALVRALSVAPDNGVIEERGERLPFEQPFWNGAEPVESSDEESDYPLPFHPLDLGDAALRAFLGFQLEGEVRADDVDPATIPLLRYRRPRPWWRPW